VSSSAVRESFKAIEEFNELGVTKFFKRYDSSRSSKFYLMFRDRLYDTKALVSAAYTRGNPLGGP